MRTIRRAPYYYHLLLVVILLCISLAPNLLIDNDVIEMPRRQAIASTKDILLIAPEEITLNSLWGGQCPIVLENQGPEPVNASVAIIQNFFTMHSVIPVRPIPVVTIDAGSSVSLILFLRVELDYYEGLYDSWSVISHTRTSIILDVLVLTTERSCITDRAALIYNNDSMRLPGQVDINIVIVNTSLLALVTSVIGVIVVVSSSGILYRRRRVE